MNPVHYNPGMTQPPLYDFGGAGPVLHLAVANGFPPQTYTPLLDPLTASYRVVSLLPRALWPQIDPPPQTPGSWQELADDMLDGLRQYAMTDVIAVGHSFGAVASLRAALTEPDRFRALILLDPTILPQRITEAIKAARAQDQAARLPLVDSALRRRHRFADVDEAYTYWRDKPLFSDWPDDTLRLYAESLTRPAGDGLELAWPREWEAYYYLSVDADIWDELPRLRDLLPTLIIQGEKTDTYVNDSARRVREILPDAAHVTLAGYGHLFPLAAPDATRQVMADWLRELS